MEKNNYIIQYLPSFNKELSEIIYYLTFILKNKRAAERLLDKIKTEIEKRSLNPESFEIYKGKRTKKYNWYRIYIGNFTIYYTVKGNIVEIAHLIYSKRDLNSIL